MSFEISVINDRQLGPFSIGETYEDQTDKLTASGIGFTFKVKKNKEYITIEKPMLNGIQFKEIGTYSELQTKLIRIDSFEHQTLDELSNLSEFLQSIFGQPDELQKFGDKKDFVHELFQNSEHKIVRDAYQRIQV
jgi:hypothetical protein